MADASNLHEASVPITIVMTPTIIAVMMPLSPFAMMMPMVGTRFVMAAPIAVAPIAMTIVDDRRGCMIAGRLVDDGRRRCAPPEWI
jgi:hypothetical protein